MEKKLFLKFCATITALIVSTVFFVGCFGSDSPENASPQEYIIQYWDDSGIHQLTVTEGMPYSLNVLPERDGYQFLGLYDAEVGGTQYVSASGASLSTFNDGKNLVLFSQFKAKDYTIILDYQGAAVTGSRQFTVTYNSSLPELPNNLSIDHGEFVGWYTDKNCKGKQVSDKYGLIPVGSILNDLNFDLNSEYIYLYAGFEAEKNTVTFCFESGMDVEEVQVPYNTRIRDVATTTRVNGNAVLTWSKTQGGEVWNGKVTNDMVLYAVEYAPVIEFDCNGGDKVNPVVARASTYVSLPTPTKDLAKFSHWEDMSGNTYNSTTMPTNSISLKAVWDPKLVFDENGGFDVEDISVAAGKKITLPTPEKEGFIFAGWYTDDKEQFTFSTMPSVGVTLKAGWYKEKTDTAVLISASEQGSGRNDKPRTDTLCYKFNYDKYFNDANYRNIKIDWRVSLKHLGSKTYTAFVNFYSKKEASSGYLIEKLSFDNLTSTYREFTFSTLFSVNENFYICWYNLSYYSGDKLYITDFSYTVHYPDATNLYL